MLSTNEYKSILGYLPSTIIKNVIEKRVDLSKQLPQHYITDSVGLFSDISGFTKLSEAFSKKLILPFPSSTAVCILLKSKYPDILHCSKNSVTSIFAFFK